MRGKFNVKGKLPLCVCVCGEYVGVYVCGLQSYNTTEKDALACLCTRALIQCYIVTWLTVHQPQLHM